MFALFIRGIEKLSYGRYIVLSLALVCLAVRVATFFVEYYYPDMIVSYLNRTGLNGGWPPMLHKGRVYTFFLDISFSLFGWSARSLHMMAYFLTLGEALLVYALAKLVWNHKTMAYMAAFFFIIVTSTSLPEIMVPNGEQVFMLFFLFGFVCFIQAYFNKKYVYYWGVLLSIILALGSKETGMWLPLTLAFCVYIDWIKTKYQSKRALWIGLCAIFFLGLCCIALVFFIALSFPDYPAFRWLYNAWYYILSYPKFNIVKWIGVLFLPFCHPFYFLFPVANLGTQWKRDDFQRREVFLYAITFCLFLSAFAGGTRLYQHYFFPLYPLLAMFSAHFIVQYANRKSVFFSKIGGVSLFNMLVIFGLYIYWALVVNVFQNFYFQRAELTPNSYSVFLYPNHMERETIQFLQQEKKRNPKLEIYIWPIGHVMGYFSKLPFKLGAYIDVEDNACILNKPIQDCAKHRVDSFFQLNKSGDIFVEYRGILDPKSFSPNPLKEFFQRGMSAHQNLFAHTEEFAKAIDKEMNKRGAKRIFNVKDSLYLWEKP